MLKIKRVYDKKSPTDGRRLYIDRIWARGLNKEEAGIDEWFRELSPSSELRKWFGHDPRKWLEFRERYIKELSTPAKHELLRSIARMAAETIVTIVYSARDTEHNNAVVLQELINKLVTKPVSRVKKPAVKVLERV